MQNNLFEVLKMSQFRKGREITCYNDDGKYNLILLTFSHDI